VYYGFRTVGTAVGRRTRRAVAVIGLATAVRSASIVTGKRIISRVVSLPRLRPRLLLTRRRRRQHATATLSSPAVQPITADLHEQSPRVSLGAPAAGRPLRVPWWLNLQRLTSVRRHRSVITAAAAAALWRQHPSVSRQQQRVPTLPPLSYNWHCAVFYVFGK